MARLSLLLTGSLFVLLNTHAMAGDWPQFRYDAGRTAASPEQLAADLHLHWVRQMARPQPAFPSNARLEYDKSYEPVVVGHSLIVPSMLTESVTAIDTVTGNEKWTFFAEGPIRFAPAAWKDRLYFAADDGYLYCLDAADGRFRWKFRGLPRGEKDRTLLGNGHLISHWPARGGPVIRDGNVYFAAGLWPADGVYVHALDATTGKVIWSNTTSNFIPEANQDHGIAQYAGLAPQGYLAIVGSKLVVPCGAQLPAFLDLETGRLDSYNMGWGGRDGLPKGSWFVAAAGKYLCQSGDLYDISRLNDEKFRKRQGREDFKSKLYSGGFTRIRVDAANQKDIGRFKQPVMTPEAFYENDGGIVARDLTAVKLTTRAEATLPDHRKDDTFPDKFTATFRELWKLPSKLQVHIKAGDQLFCAGPGTIAAVRVGAPGTEPKINWQVAIKGTPQRLVAADGRLFAVTEQGAIYAFGPEQPTEVAHYGTQEKKEQSAGKSDNAIYKILKTAGLDSGYALVLGCDSGQLIERLIDHTDLFVIGVDKDAERVANLRRTLHSKGEYGRRAVLRVGDPDRFPFPPYLASLVVSETPAAYASRRPEDLAKSLSALLRPYGGTSCFQLEAAEGEAAAGATQVTLGELTVRRSGELTLFQREGALAGSADWSHELANAAGTGASVDRFVKAPLGLLWFDASLEWFRKPGAAVVRVAGGRVLVKSTTLQAIDAYTGRRMWEAKLPFTHRPSDQMVTAKDAIYVAGSKQCVALDPVSGDLIGQINLPDSLPGTWQNLRCWGDFLVANSGPALVCFDRHSRKLVWQFRCNRQALSICAGGGRVFCAELLDRRRGEKEKSAVKTRAFEIESGSLVWEVPGGSPLLYSEPLDRLVSQTTIYDGSIGRPVADLPKQPPSAKPLPAASIPKPLFAIGDKLLWGTVQSFTVLDLTTGKPVGGRTDWVRRGCTTIRASENLVTTRVRANAAYIDLETREPTSLWNIRPACWNNLYPADGVLNAPNVLGGCTCNYTHASQAYVPVSVIQRED